MRASDADFYQAMQDEGVVLYYKYGHRTCHRLSQAALFFAFPRKTYPDNPSLTGRPRPHASCSRPWSCDAEQSSSYPKGVILLGLGFALLRFQAFLGLRPLLPLLPVGGRSFRPRVLCVLAPVPSDRTSLSSFFWRRPQKSASHRIDLMCEPFV